MKKHIKTFKSILILVCTLVLFSCNKSKNAPADNKTDDLGNYKLTATVTDENYNINLYTPQGSFAVGYNDIIMQIVDKDGKIYNDFSATWEPVMHMTSMTHTCPVSKIVKREGSLATYVGYIVFNMPSNATEYWELKINYIINGTNRIATSKVNVNTTTHKTLQSFEGTFGENYILAMCQPQQPKTGVNDMSALLFKKTSSNTYESVSGYAIKIDPRMPSMGNHSSPNNVDLTQTGSNEFYNGKLNLSMTGDWKISLQVRNGANEVIKGEIIDGSVESSSIYFEISY